MKGFPIHIFEKVQDIKVFVIGDVMIDRYINGSVERISPEAPVPVVNYKSTENNLGGAANVALNIASLNAQISLFSVIGNDENSLLFKNILEKANISTKGLIHSEERVTTVKTRVLAGKQQLLRIDEENKQNLSKKETKALLARFEQQLEAIQPDVIVFQDYNKGVLTPEIIQKVITLANDRQIITTVDPKKNNFWSYKSTTLFKPNLREIRTMTDFEIDPTKLESLNKAADFMRQKLNCKICMITLSEHGIYIDDKETTEIYPTFPAQITDVCGAGDTVISLASIGLAIGLSAKEIAELSNTGGALVCGKIGVVPVDKNELIQTLKFAI